MSGVRRARKSVGYRSRGTSDRSARYCGRSRLDVYYYEDFGKPLVMLESINRRSWRVVFWCLRRLAAHRDPGSGVVSLHDPVTKLEAHMQIALARRILALRTVSSEVIFLAPLQRSSEKPVLVQRVSLVSVLIVSTGYGPDPVLQVKPTVVKFRQAAHKRALGVARICRRAVFPRAFERCLRFDR